MPKDTPQFKEIVCSSSDNRSHIYGLTSNGDVYSWDTKKDEPSKSKDYATYHREWVQLKNEE